MAGMRRITIPDEEQATLSILGAMPIESFNALCAGIENTPATFSVEDFAKEVQHKNPDDLDGVTNDWSKITELAIYASRATSGSGLEVAEVLDALVELASKDKPKGFSGTVDELRRRLTILIAYDSVQITASAGAILTAHPYIYNSAQFHTDVRPVFTVQKDGIVQEPTASVLIHQLQIRMRHNQRLEEWFVALDDDDLLQLREAVDIALRRSTVLRLSEKIAGRTILIG